MLWLAVQLFAPAEAVRGCYAFPFNPRGCWTTPSLEIKAAPAARSRTWPLIPAPPLARSRGWRGPPACRGGRDLGPAAGRLAAARRLLLRRRHLRPAPATPPGCVAWSGCRDGR